MDAAEFPAFQEASFSALVAATKAARTLSNEDIQFNRSFDGEFGQSLDKTNAKILQIANQLVKAATAGSDVRTSNIDNVDTLEIAWPAIAEVIDFLLEKADTCLDEYTGVIKKRSSDDSRLNTTAKRNPIEIKKLINKSLHMPKPQASFAHPLDPTSDAPFRPRLTVKPHGLRSLQKSLLPTIEKGRQRYPHPYAYEIDNLLYPGSVFEDAEPTMYTSFQDTSATWVDTVDTLEDMLMELKSASEIAVDLEHHDNRSYIGIVCLMQISIRNKDWIIDTLKLRDELSVLNEVFTDPKIVKVLHGAFMDVIWLQRDLGIYLVGLFDTYDATVELGFSGHSLAFLLKKYVNFDADKRYQLADWRVRPLPQEMLDYARSDTHFLLYIYDNVRNELRRRSNDEVDLTKAMLNNSKETSRKIYETETYDPEAGSGSNGWAHLLKRNPTIFTPEQFAVFKAVHAWRDQVARTEDESLHYVLAKHQIFHLARQVPKDLDALLMAVTPASPVVKKHGQELVDIIKHAYDNPLPLPVDLFPQELPRQITTEGPITRGITINDSLGLTPGDLKTNSSQFWADTYGGSRWEVKSLFDKLQDISLALPLPKLTAAVFVNGNSQFAQQTTPKPEDMETKHIYTKDRLTKNLADDIIIVKQVGGSKRKPNTPLETQLEPAIVQDIADTSPVIPGLNIKRRRKDDGQSEEPELERVVENEVKLEPFDYTKAPSVLHGKKSIEKGFDPYSQTGDGPRAARGGKREKEGKSFTFKNK